MTTTAGYGKFSTAAMTSATTLQRHAFMQQLIAESLLDTTFFRNSDMVAPITLDSQGRAQSVPGKMILDVTPSGDMKGARDVIVTLMKALIGGVQGNTTIMAAEQDLIYKVAKAYANDYANGVKGQNFGIEARETDWLKMANSIKPLLKQWYAEYKDRLCWEALLLTRDSGLAAAPLSLTQPINPNWFVPGAAGSGVPAFSNTPATFLANVVALLKDTTTATNIHLTLANIIKLGTIAKSKRIAKLTETGGTPSWRLYLCDEEYDNLINPGTDTSFAKQWIQAAALTNPTEVTLGDAIQIGNITCIRASRAPTVYTTSASSPAASLAAGFLKEGDVDSRSSGVTANIHFNINVLVGSEALLSFSPEAAHFEFQEDEARKFKNTYIYGADGMQIPNFNIDTPTDSSIRNQSSIIIPTQKTI